MFSFFPLFFSCFDQNALSGNSAMLLEMEDPTFLVLNPLQHFSVFSFHMCRALGSWKKLILMVSQLLSFPLNFFGLSL